MRAVYLNHSEASFEENYSPAPRADCIAVDVLQAGICDTDLQLIKAYMNFQGVIGHEFVGIARDGKFAGQRVAGEINCSCHQCPTCLSGLPNHCPHRTVIGIMNHDGAFAEIVWVPERNLHRIPDVVSNDQAVFVEPLAAAFQIPAQLDLSAFGNIVLLGDGRLGNLCAQVIQLSGRSLQVVGKHPEKLARLSAMGVETTLLKDLPQNRVADLVIDCTGSPSGLSTAFQTIKPRGTIVLKSTYATGENLNLAPTVIDELTILGSRCGPFDRAIRALENNEIDVMSLVTSRFPLEQALNALEVAQQKDQLKVILEVRS